ncbi:MAG: hypothetical protein JXM79_17275 [Sedimentisphaerales bacterium]|nr:hypothetical protein [Sedimentisphaerales bacterium]
MKRCHLSVEISERSRSRGLTVDSPGDTMMKNELEREGTFDLTYAGGFLYQSLRIMSSDMPGLLKCVSL